MPWAGYIDVFGRLQRPLYVPLKRHVDVERTFCLSCGRLEDDRLCEARVCADCRRLTTSEIATILNHRLARKHV
jgi:hypothetical protein